MIDEALDGTTVTVVCIGHETAGRKYVNYEIEQSIERGNGVVGVQVHHLRDQAGQTDLAGAVPPQITAAGFHVYEYASIPVLARRIEEAAQLAGKL